MSLAAGVTSLALRRRITWAEAARLMELAEADTAQAVAQVEFDSWWNGRVLATRRVVAVYEMLEPRRLA